MVTNAASSVPPVDPAARKRTIMTSVIGQVLEWYDFFLYGTAAALVFGKLFFPVGQDPLTGTIAAFGGATVGFLARPLGGIICGHLGDRYGRKATMMLTLGIMGVATFCMGLLPTYHQIGIAAPILLVLLRVIQGLAAGGEWTGSILMISESTPPHRRGFLSSWSPSGAALGFVLSTAVFLVMQVLPEPAFLSWGWRVPFLLSILIIGVGIYMRTRVPESAEFAETVQQGELARMPIIDALRQCPKQIMSVFGLRFGEGGASYLFFAFSIVYAKTLGVSNTLVLSALTFSMLLLIPMALLSGHLSDHLGRKPMYMLGSLAIIVFAYPFFLLLQTREPWLIVTALVIANSVILGILEGAQPAFVSELMPAHVRFSGCSIGRELASVLGAGIAPLVATALLLHYQRPLPVALYLAFMGLVSVVTVWLTPETLPIEARRRRAMAVPSRA